MSESESDNGRGFMQGEKPLGVSSCSVGLRGFESHPPHQFTGTYKYPSDAFNTGSYA
jgi:hypothetical protein